ncbi:hypothetical protein CALVIDRAFT_134138 [Calocera viscosa TUFC12733]|uniref:F-box domain-containing protein n=1 Tax=Calocera viscosa (strain TUFC12733) TaxID=1330018 RepID=A0A167LWX9_CALVF|nr:hypothetical protein CALVIDRAFT_134138 [Calocera viscosa TUFC12733]
MNLRRRPPPPTSVLPCCSIVTFQHVFNMAKVDDPSSTAATKRGRKRKDPLPLSDATEPKQTIKRRKLKATRVIKWVEETPTDIMLEIMSYLKPIDILNLSYTCRSMRASLTAPDSKPVWVHARVNVRGLPDLPPDFTETRYAAFMFKEVCQMCGAVSRPREELIDLRVRLCNKCMLEHCIHGTAARGILGTPEQLLLLWGHGLLSLPQLRLALNMEI